MSSEEIKALLQRMDKLTKVIAISAVKDRPSEDQVSILNELGFTQSEISSAIGMSQGNISKILSRLNSKSTKPQKEEVEKA